MPYSYKRLHVLVEQRSSSQASSITITPLTSNKVWPTSWTACESELNFDGTLSWAASVVLLWNMTPVSLTSWRSFFASYPCSQHVVSSTLKPWRPSPQQRVIKTMQNVMGEGAHVAQSEIAAVFQFRGCVYCTTLAPSNTYFIFGSLLKSLIPSSLQAEFCLFTVQRN